MTTTMGTARWLKCLPGDTEALQQAMTAHKPRVDTVCRAYAEVAFALARKGLEGPLVELTTRLKKQLPMCSPALERYEKAIFVQMGKEAAGEKPATAARNACLQAEMVWQAAREAMQDAENVAERSHGRRSVMEGYRRNEQSARNDLLVARALEALVLKQEQTAQRDPEPWDRFSGDLFEQGTR